MAQEDKNIRQKKQYVRVIAVIWIVVGLFIASVLGIFNLFITGIMATGGEPYEQTANLAALMGIFWIGFGVGAVLVGLGLLKFNYYVWIVFEIQTGVGVVSFLVSAFSGGLFALEIIPMEIVYFGAALGCLALLIFTYTLRDQFSTKT